MNQSNVGQTGKIPEKGKEIKIFCIKKFWVYHMIEYFDICGVLKVLPESWILCPCWPYRFYSLFDFFKNFRREISLLDPKSMRTLLLGLGKLTSRLSEFKKNLNAATWIFQKWPVSRLFTNIFFNLKFAEEHKW